MRSTRRLITCAAVAATALICATLRLDGQSAPGSGEWRTWGGDLANTRYRPFDQITASNFSTLEIAWRFRTEHLGPRPEFNLEATPLMVGGIVYTTAGSRRAAVAIDAATG